jgi:integrase
MSNKYQPFRAIRKPVGLKSSFDLVVVDGVGKPHLPLTIFYHKFRQQRSDGTARTYLNNILPFFSYLTTDAWRLRRGDRWNSPPCDVLEAVRDYLVERLKCKVQPKDTYAFVGLTEYSPPTVRLFLAALKQFYFIMNSEGKYAYTNPLLDMASQLIRELERDKPEAHHRAPQRSGVEEPFTQFPSENFFRVAHEEWEVHPAEDPDLGKKLIGGFAEAGFSLRDQIVVRMALETGGRIREILRLTVGDWRARGCNQEVKAFSKGSRGRRVKTLRFSSTTAII